MYNDLHNVRDVWINNCMKECEGFENFTLRNQELIQSIPDDSAVSPLERFIFLEEMKLVLDAMLFLTYKELIVLMMRNYEGASLRKVCDYFRYNRGEILSEYIVRTIERDALEKVKEKIGLQSSADL